MSNERAFAVTREDLPVVRHVRDCILPLRMSAPLLPIGAFEYVCAIMVAELGREAYLKQVQLRLQETVGAHCGRTINAGQVSGALRSLKKRGFLTSTSAPNPAGAGAPIIVYSITETGARLMQLASAACAFANGDETSADDLSLGDNHADSAYPARRVEKAGRETQASRKVGRREAIEAGRTRR